MVGDERENRAASSLPDLLHRHGVPPSIIEVALNRFAVIYPTKPKNRRPDTPGTRAPANACAGGSLGPPDRPPPPPLPPYAILRRSFPLRRPCARSLLPHHRHRLRQRSAPPGPCLRE